MNKMNILNEMREINSMTANSPVAITESKVTTFLESLEEVDMNQMISPKTVRIFQEGDRFLIDVDEVDKLAESFDIDPIDAMGQIVEENGIPKEDTYFVVDRSMYTMVTENVRIPEVRHRVEVNLNLIEEAEKNGFHFALKN